MAFPDTASRRGLHSATALLALALSLLCWCPTQPARAAVRDYYFAREPSDQALAQHTVTALLQDEDGFVWIGTQSGLNRFDGQRYVLFQFDPDDPASLPGNYITALARDGGDGLWIGTYSQYLAHLDLRDGSIRRYALDPEAGIPGRHVYALATAPDVLWLGTGRGLERLDPDDGRRELVLPLSAKLLSDQPQALLRDPRGDLWYASNAGLFRLPADAATGGTPIRVGSETALHSLLLDRSGRLWVGGRDGLFLVRNRDTLLSMWPQPGSREDRDVRALVAAPDGRLWFSVAAYGIRRYDPTSGATLSLRQQPMLPGSLPEDAINALLIDASGRLWVGGQYHGIAVADSSGARFRYLVDQTLRQDQNQPAQDSSIRAIYQDRMQRLWLGADDGRLLRYQPGTGFSDFSMLLPEPPGTPSGQRVMAFADAGDGRPWVATTLGLFRLDPAIPALQPVPIPGIPAPRLRSIAMASDGMLWLGTDHDGVIGYRPDDASVRTIPYLDGDPRGLSNPQVHALLPARNGRLWIGTGHGLDLYDPRNGQLQHFGMRDSSHDGLSSDLVRALWQDRAGAVWVGSHGGLDRLRNDGHGGFLIDHPLAEALQGESAPVVFSLAGDTAGKLWLGTNRGLMRFAAADGRLHRYGINDGVQNTEFNGGAVAVLAGGRLAFGGVSGLNVFDPTRIRDSRLQPPLHLLSLRIGAQRNRALVVPWRRGRIEMPEAAGLLRLRIGALDYLDQGAIRYRYRIDGLDDDWIENGNQGEITYTLLPAGAYLFRAQSTNHDGVWNPQELRIPLVVTPPAWRSLPALVIYALLLVAIAWMLWWMWRGRRRRERNFYTRIHDREQRLKLALWASGEQFWDYELGSGEMQRMRVDEEGVRNADDIQVESVHELDHRIHPDDLPLVRDRIRRHLRGETPTFLSEHRVMDDNDDGRWVWVRAQGRAVERDGSGRVLRLSGTARDITRSRHAERERRIASEVLRSMNEAVAVIDMEFRFISVNPAFTRMTGYSEADVIGLSANMLDSHQHDPEFYHAVRAELTRTGHWSGEMWQQRKDGEEFLCAIESSAVLDSAGKRSLYVTVLSDITDQKRAEQELRYLANYDTLTNLPNRTLLAERLSRAIVRARRQDERIAVLFLDLDRFKDINDSLGHAAGDRILRAAAARLQETVGAGHTVARLSGDEFTILLENLGAPEQADRIAREIITAFEAPLQLDDRREISITPSIGISLYPDHAQVPTELLKQADTAMYQAKAAGRRTYMRYSERMDATIRHRATVSGALRKVLDRNELRLVYQPRLGLAPQPRILGVEALLRWHNAEYGEIAPEEFIPLAEESGLILEIGEWVLREACLTLSRWRQHGLGELGLSVNVSALQLLRGDLPGVLERVLEETGLPASALELELTESVVMANAEQTAERLRAFRDLGVSLAIDDFGTGYSSLAYLKRLPITTLKIDKEFVDDLSQGSDDAAITTTVIAMSHSLGLHVVAEGVETEAQLRFLHAQGCDEIQGYWLSPPLEAQRCLAFIRNWTPPAALAGQAAAPLAPVS